MRVADCHDDDYALDDFPQYLPFSKVIDDDIADYSILVYAPAGTGGQSYAVVTRPEDCRIVVHIMYSR